MSKWEMGIREINCWSRTLQLLFCKFFLYKKWHIFKIIYCVIFSYGQLYLMVLRYGRNATATDLALYEISPDTSTASSFKYSLSLGLVGGCGIQIIDNIVVVHHQAKNYLLFFL